MITFVATNPSLDKTFEVERLVPGAIHRPLAFTQVAGGKAVNAARAAHELGEDVSLVLLAGGHSGAWLERQLERLGLPANVIRLDTETRSALSVLDRSDGQLTEFYEAGAEVDPEDWARFELAVRAAVVDQEWISFSGSMPPGAPADGYARLLRAAGSAGGLTALDAAGESLRLGLEAGPRLLKVNNGEAGALLGSSIATPNDAVTATRRLAQAAGAAAITNGRDGATLTVRAEATWAGRCDVRGPYPAASGDSFLAGLIVARARGAPWPDALALALGAGAANAEVPAAAGFERTRAEELARRCDVSEVPS